MYGEDSSAEQAALQSDDTQKMITLRLSEELRDRIRVTAISSGVSVNQWILSLVRHQLAHPNTKIAFTPVRKPMQKRSQPDVVE